MPGEGDATVLLGASRAYFDLQLPVWERLAGKAPIQLSYEGTSPMTALEDLAADPKFTGKLLIGVEPDLLFSGGGLATKVAHYTHQQSPSQRIGQWLSMNFIEPYFAFFDQDFALQTVLARQAWPKRPGKHWFMDVRKLSMHDLQRNAWLWDKVANDPQYLAIVREVWSEEFQSYPDDPTPAEMLQTEKQQIERAVKALAQLRSHGVRVVFLRLPSDGPFLVYEDRLYPRSRAWQGLLDATHAPGIYFEDYPQLRGYTLPEWSHMTQAEAERFTAAVYPLIESAFSAGSGQDPPPLPLAQSSGGVLAPAARLVIEANLHLHGLLATAAAEAADEVRHRRIPAAVTVAYEVGRGELARVLAGAAGDDDDVIAEMIAQSLDRVPGQHARSLGNPPRPRPHSIRIPVPLSDP